MCSMVSFDCAYASHCAWPYSVFEIVETSNAVVHHAKNMRFKTRRLFICSRI